MTTDEILEFLRRYAAGEVPVEVAAETFARAYDANGGGLYVLAAEHVSPEVQSRLDALWARYSELVGRSRRPLG